MHLPYPTSGQSGGAAAPQHQVRLAPPLSRPLNARSASLESLSRRAARGLGGLGPERREPSSAAFFWRNKAELLARNARREQREALCEAGFRVSLDKEAMAVRLPDPLAQPGVWRSVPPRRGDQVVRPGGDGHTPEGGRGCCLNSGTRLGCLIWTMWFY